MPISVSSYVATIGKYYDSAVKLSTKKLQFLTSHLIPPMLALIFCDISTSFVVYYLISSASSSSRSASSRNSHLNSLSSHKSTFGSVQIIELELDRYLDICAMFVFILLLVLANDVHPNPGPDKDKIRSIFLSIFVATVGKYYDSAVKLQINELQVLTLHLILPIFVLIFYDISTSFVVYYLISSASSSIRYTSSKNSYLNTLSPNKSTFCSVQNIQFELEKYQDICTLFVFILLLIISNDVHPNPGPDNNALNYNLSIIHINANQITNKVDIIAYEAHHHDIITVSETWLHKDSKKEGLKISGFHEPVRKDRGSDGGGVAIYVKNYLPCKHRKDLDIQDLEAVWVETYINNEKLLVGSFYRSPSMPVAYWDLIDTSLREVSAEPVKFIVLGDFNSNFLSNPSPHLLNL